MKSPLLLATLAALVLGAAPLTAQAEEEAAPAAAPAAPAAAAPAASNTNRTVAFVDLQKALNNCTEGKEAKKRLEADFDRRQKELEKAKADLEVFAKDLESSAAMLTPERKQAKMTEYQDRYKALSEGFERHQRELARAEQTATADIMKRLVELSTRIAQEKGFGMVVEKSAVVFAAPGLELTEELIRRFDGGRTAPK
jgi:outer membrane protein